MVFADNSTDEELAQNGENDASDPAKQLSGGGTGIAGPGPVGNVGGNQSAQPQSQANNANNSGGWTNLQQYLDANQDQAASAGSQIANTVSGQAQTAKNDINNDTSDFTGKVNASTVNQDPNAVSNAINDATSAKAGSILNPDDVSSFQKQANANYTGPTDFTQSGGYGQAQQDVNAASNSLQQTQSEAGRDVLLNNQYGNASPNGYTQGEKNLDQALIEGSQPAQQSLQAVNNQWTGIGNALSGATTSENALAANAQQTDAATAAAAQSALGTADSGFKTNLNSGLSAAKADQAAGYQSAQNSFGGNKLAPTDLTATGLSSGQDIYGLHLGDYLSQSNAPTLNTFATADQYAQAQALAQLAGQSGSDFLPSQYADQAGTAPTSPYSFNGNQFNSDLKSAEANYNQNMNRIAQTLSNVVATNYGVPGPGIQTPGPNGTAGEWINYWVNYMQSPNGQQQAVSSGNPNFWAPVQSAIAQYQQLLGQNTYVNQPVLPPGNLGGPGITPAPTITPTMTVPTATGISRPTAYGPTAKPRPAPATGYK